MVRPPGVPVRQASPTARSPLCHPPLLIALRAAPVILLRWRAELLSARSVVEGFSAMLDFGQFGVDLDNHVLDIDVRRQHQILRA